MARIKLVMLGVFALSAMASAVASAEPTASCTPNGGTKTLSMLCVEAKSKTLLVVGLPAAETITVLGEKEAATASSLVESNGLEVTCTAVDIAAELDGLLATSFLVVKVTVEFLNCTVPKPAHCAVSEGKITTNNLVGETSNEDGDITFKPEGGKVFTDILIVSSGGTCVTAGSSNVEGSVLGTLLKPEEELELHTLEFQKAKGLTLTGGITTEFTLLEDLILDRPAGWSSSIFAEHPPWGVFLTETIS